MAQENTRRKINFSSKFNWFDTGANVEHGKITVVGQCFAISKITINYKGIDPESSATIETDSDGFRHNFSHTEVIEYS